MTQSDWGIFNFLLEFLSHAGEVVTYDTKSQIVTTQYGEYSVNLDSLRSAWKDTVKFWYENLDKMER